MAKYTTIKWDQEMEELYQQLLELQNRETYLFWKNQVVKAPKWLSIIWKGKMVEINGKGKIREKKENRNS